MNKTVNPHMDERHASASPLGPLARWLRLGALASLVLLAGTTWAAEDKAALQEVWIAVRADGRDGVGSQVDPRDGSSPEKFDGLLARYRQEGVTNLTVHLWPGTYQTEGDAAWTLFTGWRILGAGMAETTIQLAGLSNADTAVLAGNGNGLQEVCDLTIDANYLNLPWNEGLHRIAGIRLSGPGTAVRRVRVLNTGSEMEGLAVVAVTDPATDSTIEGCVVEKPVTSFENVTAFAIGGMGAGPHALNKGCRLLGNTASGCLRAFTASGMDGLMVTYNRAIGCGYGWYQDAPVQRNVVIGRNEFLGCRFGGIVMGEALQESDTKGVEIVGNTIEVEQRGVALGLFNRSIMDVAFRFNRISSVSGWAKAVSIVSAAGPVSLENNIFDSGLYMDIRSASVTWRSNRSPDGQELQGLADGQTEPGTERPESRLMPLLPATDPEEAAQAGPPLEAALGSSGEIMDWLILGPFPHPARPFPGPGERPGGAGYDFDFLFNVGGTPGQGEATVKARTGASVKIAFPSGPNAMLFWVESQMKTQRITWQRVHAQADNGTVDLKRVPGMGPDLDNTCIYAVCHLQAAADTPARLKVGSDDGYVLFMNGWRVGEVRDDRRNFAPDAESFDVDLHAGDNRLVFKLCNAAGEFLMRIRVTDQQDQPAQGITVVLP